MGWGCPTLVIPADRILIYQRKVFVNLLPSCTAQPMVDYVIGKENQGVYAGRGGARVNLPTTLDLVEGRAQGETELPAATDLNEFLIKGYAKQIRERNSTTGG